MKSISILVLVLTFGSSGTLARDLQVQMAFSGSETLLARQVDLVPGGNSAVGELTTAGNGSLGPFTYHNVNATTVNPTGFGCAGPNSIAFTFVALGGVYRFEDGSLLTTKLKAGTVCVDLAAGSAADIITEEITGGTGRFKNASGTLTTTTTGDHPILFDVTGQQPVLIAIPDARVTGTLILPDDN